MSTAYDHTSDRVPHTRRSAHVYLTWIRASILLSNFVLTVIAVALPIILLRGFQSTLVGILAAIYGAFQWYTGKLCQDGYVESIARHWDRYDAEHPHIRHSMVLARLPSIYYFPVDYASQLWTRSLPLIGVFLALATAVRYAHSAGVSPILSATALIVVPPVAQAVRWAVLRLPRQQPETNTIRGRIRSGFEEALSKQHKLFANDCPSIPWGGLRIPVDDTLTHWTVVGNTRSGKTVNLRLFLQELATSIMGDRLAAARAVVFDPKTNFLPYLIGMGIPIETIRILHPFDARSWAWDIAADIQTPTDATNIAAKFIRDGNHGSQDFFQSAARDIFASEMIAFHMTCPGRWDLRDLLLVNRTPERAQSLLSRTPLTRHALDRYGGDARTLANVVATLRKDSAPLEPIAACWSHCGARRLSIKEWPKSNTTLLFGYSDLATEQLNIVNRCMFEQLVNVLLSQAGGSDRGRTWIVIDEGKESGKLSGLSSVMLRGAEHRVHTVLGFQSVLGMREVYGDNTSGEVIGQCNNLAVFRLGHDRKTAEWAADMIGKAERLERHHSHTEAKDASHTVSESTHDRYLYLPEELQILAATNPENGLRGIFVSEQYGVIDAADANIDGAELFERLLKPADDNTPRIVPRPDSQHYLEDWTSAELRQLGFTSSDGHAGDDPLSRVRRL